MLGRRAAAPELPAASPPGHTGRLACPPSAAWMAPRRARAAAALLHRSRAVPDDSGGPQGVVAPSPPKTKLDWLVFGSVLASCGVLTGTLLDGIHSKDALQVYDIWPLDAGGLHTSLAVPPLLALFYVVLGSLVPLADQLSPGPATNKARARAADISLVALSFGCLAALLQLSAALYAQGVPYAQIHLALGAGALCNWFIWCRTRQGLLLAVVCALGAPAAELVLLHFFPAWHYPRADLQIPQLGGFVSWVPWCYFFYTPALSNLARYLHAVCQMPADEGRGA